MFNLSSLRYRYTQFFVLFLLCSTVYVMTQSIGSGITNFQDNLYKKNFLIGTANLLRIKMGDRVFTGALLGKDGWMEYTGEGNLDDFQNKKHSIDNKNIAKKLTTLNEYLKSQGITLLIVVAPNKATIYPDKLPEQIKSLPIQSRLDSLVSYLENEKLPVLLNLGPALKTSRQYLDVYYKTDTHWNGHGAYIAYTTIINSLRSSYPELKPYNTTDLDLVTSDPGLHDIPMLMQINFITEPFIYFQPRKPFVQTLPLDNYFGYNRSSWIPDSNLPTLLMFHDSFGDNSLNEYLSMNFEKSNFIRLQSMPQYLTKETIQQFKPDVIIIEIAERNLEQLKKYISNFTSE